MRRGPGGDTGPPSSDAGGSQGSRAARNGLRSAAMDTTTAADDLVALERAIESLEHQRALLGDDVVDVALASMRERREALVSRQVEQRRLVTVLFADLVGFTFLADDLDPEDTRTVVDTYFARWRRIIEEHGGEVEKFIGDAVMAV